MEEPQVESRDESSEPAGSEPADDALQDKRQEQAPESRDPSQEEVPDSSTPAVSGRSREPASLVEAVLFGSDSPLTPSRLAEVVDLPMKEVRKAVAELNERYEKMGCSFRIDAVAGGYQMLTLPEYHQVLERLIDTRKESRLTQASMETLAIVAYRQPIIRADIEAIRGVATGEVLRGLMEKQLVKIAGRAEVVGRPMLYGTTKHFLEVFGLNSLEDLPKVEELRSVADKTPKSTPKPEAQLPFEGQPQASDNPQQQESQQEPQQQPAGQEQPPPAENQEPTESAAENQEPKAPNVDSA